jgi:hypothetical protein
MNDALNPQALISEFKAYAVQLFPARESDLPSPQVKVHRWQHSDNENSETSKVPEFFFRTT